jgi:O-antigen/teichoic acid export membrane protein
MKTSETLARDIFIEIRAREQKNKRRKRAYKRFLLCAVILFLLPVCVFFTAQTLSGTFFERAWEQQSPPISSPEHSNE